jgi:hypothetical protein
LIIERRERNGESNNQIPEGVFARLWPPAVQGIVNYINSRIFSLSLEKDNKMINQYTFTNETGWHIREYRPFNLSVAVADSPCLSRYTKPGYGDAIPGYTTRPTSDQERPAIQDTPADLVTTITGQQLKFDYLSVDVLRRLLEERILIRDKHRKDIMGRVTDLSGDIYGCYLLKTPDSFKKMAALEKTKLDLEKQARDEDLLLWRDAVELRRELVIASRKYEGTSSRTELLSGMSLEASLHDGNQTTEHPVGSGHMPGA